jgi:flagellar biosynthesis protein FlhF
MRLKTYFASSVEAAMLLALDQLGPEAMIVTSRKMPAESRHLGEYEVVFAAAPETEADEENEEGRYPDTLKPDTADREPVRRLYQEVSRLASEIESLGRVMKRTEVKQGVANLEGEQAEVAHCLAEAGFSGEFILETISGTAAGSGSLRLRVLQLMVDRLKAAPSLGRNGQGRKVAALVGPAGAGKTSLVAKLAARFGVAARRSCQILCLDSDRIGASEPLRMVAGVLGVGFRLVESAALLASALDSVRDRDLVLIDTPGFGRDESEAVESLGSVLAGRGEIDVHLVLPATVNLHDLGRMIHFHRTLNPQRLMFTRLDETDQIGTMIEVAVSSGIPLSFLSKGQRIPEDLEPASAPQLARRIFLPASVLSTSAEGFARKAAA